MKLYSNGRLLALLANVKLNGSGKHPSYYNTATITIVKGFVVQAPGACIIKPFTAVICDFRKLECLSLSSLSRIV